MIVQVTKTLQFPSVNRQTCVQLFLLCENQIGPAVQLRAKGLGMSYPSPMLYPKYRQNSLKMKVVRTGD